MERRNLRGHYEELAAEYDEHWVYGPRYIPWMSARIAETLRLTPTDRIADIGAGTGLFAREVAGQLRPHRPILCVDPSEAMLRQLGSPPPPGLAPVVASAEDIAEGRRTGERIRFHVSAESPDRAEFVIRLDQPDPAEYYR